MEPEISVIMAVYNTDVCWLRQSIESILSQSFDRFEFIIVLDRPTDGSDKVIFEYAGRDDRIVVLENEKNCGLTFSLNRALAIARGKYTARMDADDISCPHRLEAQYRYMEAHSGVAVLGSYFEYIGDMEGRYQYQILNQEKMRIEMMFRNVGVAHPTAFIRNSVLKENDITYDLSMKKAQDYKLWTDIMWFGDIIVLPEVLLKYRVHQNQISYSAIMKDTGNEAEERMDIAQSEYVQKVSLLQAEELLGPLNRQEKRIHLSLYSKTLDGYDCAELDDYLQRILLRNKEAGRYQNRMLYETVSELWWNKALAQLKASHSAGMLFYRPGHYSLGRLFWNLAGCAANKCAQIGKR